MNDATGEPLAEDFAVPVEVQPGTDDATPPGWDWRLIGTSQPNKATFHINHHDIGHVLVDVLGPSDSPEDSPFVISKDIPILIIDSLDQYWAGESRERLPLQGLRVPVAADTIEEAKRGLAADLAAQFRLLLLLSSSRQGNIAPQLLANLSYLMQYMDSRTQSKAQPDKEA
jgi:hypothetical protein